MNSSRLKSVIIASSIALASGSTFVFAEQTENKSTENADLWAKASLTTTYTLNRQLNPFDIDVDVRNGVAILNGSVENDIERDLAEQLALGVDGIDEVENNLDVRPDAVSARTDASGATDENNFIRKVEDANITAKVKSQLLWNKNTSGMSIEVTTQGGFVTLSGTVKSPAESQLAEQVAKNTSDVVGVQNSLLVNATEPSVTDKVTRESREVAQDVSDGWITTKVKTFLLYNRNVEGSSIEVNTSNGIVTLRGSVNNEQEREQAISIARDVKGVKDVLSELTTG